MIESKPIAATGSSLIDEDESTPNELLFEDTMELLTQSLLGDRFAAKFLLCSLVSSIYMRRTELVLGPITVNLNLKRDYVSRFLLRSAFFSKLCWFSELKSCSDHLPDINCRLRSNFRCAVLFKAILHAPQATRKNSRKQIYSAIEKILKFTKKIENFPNFIMKAAFCVPSRFPAVTGAVW